MPVPALAAPSSPLAERNSSEITSLCYIAAFVTHLFLDGGGGGGGGVFSGVYDDWGKSNTEGCCPQHWFNDGVSVTGCEIFVGTDECVVDFRAFCARDDRSKDKQ